VVLALGGGSWSRLGSDGAWVPILCSKGVPVADLLPANCGFDVNWSDHFRKRYAGHPVKTVVLSFTGSNGEQFRQRGECVVTEYGVEGSLIYTVSSLVRDEIMLSGRAVVTLDLLPDKTLEQLADQLSRPRGSRSLASHLQRRLGIKGVKAGLLREFVAEADFSDPGRLARMIKTLPVPLIAPRPLDEAISSAGGVMFEALDEWLMLRALPGMFCAGEMLDWEAPTGGYLLTACFASGRKAGQGVLEYLNARAKEYDG